MSSRKKRAPSDGPLKQLGELVQKAGLQLKSQRDPALPSGRKSEQPQSSIALAPDSTEEETFTEAMHDVERVSWRHKPHPASRPARAVEADTELEDQRLMQAALDEDTPIAIPEHPEYIEGWVGGLGKRFLPNLRNGLYSIQGQIDLHGLSRAEAEIAVEDYIVRMSRYRSCCVKIIHGRGINSPSDRATLKESLQRLLSTRRMSRYVVAYASAPARDGGVGAVYVLLSRS